MLRRKDFFAVLCAATLLAGASSAPALATDHASSSAEQNEESPASPTGISAIEGDSSLEVAWSDPEANGDPRVLAYDVVATPADASVASPSAVTTDGDTFFVTLPSLTNGTRYDVTVTAKTDSGSSLSAAVSGTPRTVPRSPTLRSVRAGDGSALVTWDPPDDDGGAPVTAYVIEAQPSGQSVNIGSGRTSGRVSSLQNGDSTTFTVSGVNAAGKGAPSKTSRAVTPRALARFVITRQPARRVLFGTRTRVGATLVMEGGVALSGQRVELLAKARRSDRWKTVGTDVTDGNGRVSLRTRLQATSALRLHHPASIVAADDAPVRSVVVAKRVAVGKGKAKTRVYKPVVISGRVAPKQRMGSVVRLQRRTSGSWRRVVVGHMVTRSRFVIRWKPQRAGSYSLRVVSPPDERHAAGTSKSWRHRVLPESAADIAKDILRDKDIKLETLHASSGSYLGSPEQNIIDIANGRPARHSCHGGAPCSTTRIDLRVLKAVRDMGTRGTLTVSEFAGGVHSSGSAHYSGDAVDINWVNGRHVGWGTSDWMVVDRCRAYGAKDIYSPTYDPYGGHHNHVHCGW